MIFQKKIRTNKSYFMQSFNQNAEAIDTQAV